MKCYKTILRVNSLLKNYGFFIVGFITAFYFFVLLIFIVESFGNIKKEIYNIIFAFNIKGNPIKKKVHKKIKINFEKSDIKNVGNKEIKQLFNLNKNKVNKRRYEEQLTQNISDKSYNKLNKRKY